MYRCCNIKHFCRLLVLDAVIFTVFAAAFAVGRIMIRVAAGERDEMSIRLPVIMYHSGCDKPPSEYVVTPKQLEDDLDTCVKTDILRYLHSSLWIIHGAGENCLKSRS